MNKIKQLGLATTFTLAAGLNAFSQGSKNEKKEAIKAECAQKIDKAVMDHPDVVEVFQKYVAKREEVSDCESLSNPNIECVRLDEERVELDKELAKVKRKIKKGLKKEFKEEIIELEHEEEDRFDKTVMNHPDVKKAKEAHRIKEEKAFNSEGLSPEELIKAGNAERKSYKYFCEIKAKTEKKMKKEEKHSS